MIRRQSRDPEQWWIATQGQSPELARIARKLARGTGIMIVRNGRSRAELHRIERRLRPIATSRGLKIEIEAETRVARVHNVRELRVALARRTRIIMLSPIHPTESHPSWAALPRMRVAALARLAKRRVYALGGMDRGKFRRIAPLGFVGWAGIGAFRI